MDPRGLADFCLFRVDGQLAVPQPAPMRNQKRPPTNGKKVNLEKKKWPGKTRHSDDEPDARARIGRAHPSLHRPDREQLPSRVGARRTTLGRNFFFFFCVLFQKCVLFRRHELCALWSNGAEIRHARQPCLTAQPTAGEKQSANGIAIEQGERFNGILV